MRLLDAKALIYNNVANLVDFPDASRAPRYAILSHTWGVEEVLFQDIHLGPQHELVDDYRNDASFDLGNYTYDSDTESVTSASSDMPSLGDPRTHVKRGWNKVWNTCLLVVRDDLRYVWIDTCKSMTCLFETSAIWSLLCIQVA